MLKTDKQYNIDRRAISLILLDGDLKTFSRARINSKFFTSKVCRMAYEWIRNYNEKYNRVPSKALFREQFPNFKLLASREPAEFFVDELVKRKTFKAIVDAMAAAGEALTESPEKALAALNKGVEEAQRNSNRIYDIRLDHDTDDLIKRYKKRKGEKEIAGIPFGLPPLDEWTDGLLPGQLALVFGDQSIGKSWFLVIIAVAAILRGYKVLYITKENSMEEISGRVHALLAHVSSHRLKKGQLTPYEEKKLGRRLPRIKKIVKRFVLSTQDEVDDVSLGTEGIRSKIQQYRPELAIVDGLYLVEDTDLAGAEYSVMRKVAYRTKRIARKEHVALLVSTQANADAANSDSGAANASGIAYARGVSQPCDIIINLYTNEELDQAGCRGVTLMKQREGPQNERFVISWDFDTCNFQAMEMPTESDDEEVSLPG